MFGNSLKSTDIKNIDIAIIPCGSFEQHGELLPLDTDTKIALGISDCLVKDFKDKNTIVLPALNYGSSFEHIDYNGTVTINTVNLYHYVEDILNSIALTIKPKLVVLLNAHGGNINILNTLATDFCYKNEMKVAFIHAYSDQVIKKAEELFGSFDTHAGSVEASLYFFLNGKSVNEMYTNDGYIKKIGGGLALFRTKNISDTGVISDVNTIEINTEKANILANFISKDIQERIKNIEKKINIVC